jgi:hypothetical protein
MTDKRKTIVRDQKPNTTKVDLVTAASITPSYYQSEYPKFIQFLEKYLEYIRDDQGFGNLINQLRDIRNIDVTEEKYAEILKDFEFGKDFPNIDHVDDSLAIRLFEFFYKAKGTKESIERYFEIFVGTPANISYPKDNILIVDGGNWNNTTSSYNTVESHLDEATMVLQDDYYYQIYSYLIKSGSSIVDWGDTFRKVVHPAGWNVFGQVEIVSLAKFNNVVTNSPTIVPGFQPDIFAFAKIISQASHNMATFDAQIDLILENAIEGQPSASFDTYSLQDVNTNLLLGTYTIGSFADTPISNFDPSVDQDNLTSRQRPARIVIT